MNDDHNTVIGYTKNPRRKGLKNKQPQNTNGTPSSLSLHTTSTDLVSSKYSHATSIHHLMHLHFSLRERRKYRRVHPISLESYPQVSHPLSGTDSQRMSKLDRENEVGPPVKIALSVGRVGRILTLVTRVCSLLQAIQAARTKSGLSQSDVARSLNQKVSVIQDYESGKAIPDQKILAKLERVLGVKLRGKINSDHSKQL
jgi:DNA-binding XRE family transcriptional regulator